MGETIKLKGKKPHPVGRSGAPYFALVLLGLWIIIQYPFGARGLYQLNYALDGASLLVVVLLLIQYSARRGFDIFDSLNFISLIYAAMFFFMPMYDICIGEYLWFGYNLFEWGPLGTLYALIGYLVFYLVYTRPRKKPIRRIITRQVDEEMITSSRFLIPAILVVYALSFLANVYYMVAVSGNSLAYILSFGFLGSSGGDTTDTQIGFIGMFSYCLPTATLLYWAYGKSKTLKTVLFVPMLMLQVSRGFRFIIVEILVMFMAFYFMRRGERPKLLQIALALLALMIPVLCMTWFRSDIRAGAGADFSSLGSNAISDGFDEAVFDNLRIYQNYYGLIMAVPENYPYVFAERIVFDTLRMVVPHAIWPGKYANSHVYGLDVLVGGNFIGTGQAYPSLGEYYYALGPLGIAICMGLYALWMRHVRDKYMHTGTCYDLVFFAVLLSVNLQLIIRGYMPSNFWFVVFSVIPIYAVVFLGRPRKLARIGAPAKKDRT